jgi:hypothetical protein
MTLLLGNGLKGRNGRSSAGSVGNGVNQCARVFLAWPLEDLFDRTRLNDFSAPHDSNIVGDDANDAEIVTHKDASEPELAVDRLEQGEDLRRTETSSADVGSSATIKEGRRMIARAMATR